VVSADSGLWRRFSRAGIGTWLLAAFCGWAVLLWLAALAGLGAHLQMPPPQMPGALPAPLPPAPDRIGPLSQYAEAAARPLFTEDRRPHAFIANATDAESSAGTGFDFLLTGVLISPQVRLAILQPSNGGPSQRVREGAAPEGAPGWRLLAVQPRRAIFEGPEGQVTLEMRVSGAPALPPELAKPGAAPTPPVEATAAAATDDQQRIDDLRRRIEERRAQLQQSTSDSPATGSASPHSGRDKPR